MRTRRIAGAACAIATGSVALAGDLEQVLGGMRYDNWWVATGAVEPTTTHPLYPAGGLQSGSITWRCAECHGWDYQGVDGAYGSGDHSTGIVGVLGSTMSPQQQFDLIKHHHGYADAGLSDGDIWYIVEFLQNSLVDTGTYVSPAGEFFGDPNQGRFEYLGANDYYSCDQCHGRDASAPSAMATADPWQFLHKVRFSDPVGTMPSTALTGGDAVTAADIGAYLRAGQPGPSYAGDEACMSCHENSPEPGFYEGYLNMGHARSLIRTAGETPAPGTWSHQPVPPLPVIHGEQIEWSDVEYVLGNYHWQTRFIGRDGFVITGDVGETGQWNLWSQSWAPFNAGVNLSAHCGKCHATGWQPTGHQHGLPGITGTWAFDGVQCETCHGPASDHVEWPTLMTPEGGQQCNTCHIVDPQFRIRWANGFMLQHVQGESLLYSPHAGNLDCSSCHNPHRSTVKDDGGVITECTDCHPGDTSNNSYQIADMPSVGCTDCHMPKSTRTSEAHGPYVGDGSSHLFRIMTAPLMAAQNTYQEDGKTFWKTTPQGKAYLTLDYACMGCHEQIGDPITIEDASAYAANIHGRQGDGSGPCPADMNGDGVLDLGDVSLFAAAFVAQDLAADLNEDGLLDLADISLFVTLFTTGCP